MTADSEIKDKLGVPLVSPDKRVNKPPTVGAIVLRERFEGNSTSIIAIRSEMNGTAEVIVKNEASAAWTVSLSFETAARNRFTAARRRGKEYIFDLIKQ